jgi:DNA-binding beta-propeller fold protein YncE
MRKKIIAVAIFFIFNVTLLSGLSGQDSMQSGQKRQRIGEGGQKLSSDIQELVNAEKSSATTAQNVQERYKKLMRIIMGMLRSDMLVDTILPKEEGQKIEALLKDGGLDEVAQKVHDAIMKLETVGAGQSDSGIRQRTYMMHGQRVDTADHFISSVPVSRLDIHQMANKNNLGNILKLMNLAIDSDRRRLYFGGTKSTFIGVVDIDKDELIETFDIGIPCGFLIPDPASGDIYSFDIPLKKFYRIDVKQRAMEEVTALPSNIAMPKKGKAKNYKNLSYTETGYPFETGYLQDENAAYGVIVISDSSGRQVGNIKHGPDALYFDIDEKTGKLYATNTGDASISVFDLNNQNRRLKDIDVGTSVEELVLDSKSGGLYIRNRLGGSTVFFYNPTSKNLSIIPNENMVGGSGIGLWPTQIIYDGGKLYVLSHYTGRIDVANASTHKITGSILLKLSYKPRTDGLSTMVMDRTRKILYAAFPELGEIAVADAKNLKHIKTVKINRYDTKKTGAGRIVLSVDEKSNKLFAYLAEEKRLNVYDGSVYLMEKDISLDVGRAERLLTSNPEKEVLYAGNRILDAKTFDEKGRFAKGDMVIAFDNKQNKIYLTGKTGLGLRKMIEKVYEYEGTMLRKEWTLAPVSSQPSSFAFDFTKSRFYAGYFESAVVEAFALTAGSEPSSDPADLSPYGESEQRQTSMGRGNQKQTMGSEKGRCGDGICQSIERETGRCPEDCK